MIDDIEISETHQQQISIEYNKIDAFLEFAQIALYTIIVIASITYISLLIDVLSERKYEIGLYRTIGYKGSSISKIFGYEMIISGMISSVMSLAILMGFSLHMYGLPYNELSFVEIVISLNVLVVLLGIVFITIIATLFVIVISNKRNLSKTIISNITDL